MSEQKTYCGSGKEKKFDNGGSIISVSVCLDDYPEEFINEYKGKRYLRLNIASKREPDQYGKTHSVSVDTWQPDQAAQSQPAAAHGNGQFDSEIPF